jgi:pimeloyl-ACP methyl ester carboxylesterase
MLGMTPEAFEVAQKGTMANLTKSPEGQVQGLADSLASDRAVLAETMAEVMVRDARTDLGAITTPFTVLQAYDAAMPVPKETYTGLWSTAYAGLKGVQIKVIDNSYHFIMWDQPQAFAEAVAAFMTAP